MFLLSEGWCHCVRLYDYCYLCCIFQKEWTALKCAVSNNCIEIVEILLNAGADVNHKDNEVC